MISSASQTLPDPDLAIRGGGGHPDPEKMGGGGGQPHPDIRGGRGAVNQTLR